jgi:DNA gyrase/topoisomerase IV subunit A
VGWSTDILPHSLESLIDAVVAAIDQKPLPVLIPSYDFLQVNVRDLGGNGYEFQGQVDIVSSTLLKVTELPPDLSLEKFRARLNQMEDDDLIHSYTDRSTKTINIEIRMKRGSMESWTQEQAVNFLKLRSKSTQRLVVLDFNNTSIRQFANSGELVQAFVEWRLTWYTKRYLKLIEQAQRDLTWYQALKLCYDQKLPVFLPQAANKQAIAERVQKITSKLPIDADQIDRITQLPSYRWAQDQYQDTLDKIAEQEKLLAQYQAMLASPAALRKQYRQEVTALKKLKLVHK